MCLHPSPVEPVPEATARVARAAFPKGNDYLRMRDELGAIFEDEHFAHLFPPRGKPAFSPWRLALVTVLQFAEGLPDRKAADAVRARIDWKYVLSLELTDPGFDASVLCEFRARLLDGESEGLLFDVLLERLRERGLVKERGRQRTDSTHVLAAVRDLNRLELIGETMRHALETLAVAGPAWLREHAKPEWVRRYARRFEDDGLPKGKEARRTRAEEIGEDGHALLDAVRASGAPAWLREVPAVETLRRVWIQQYLGTPSGWRFRGKEDGLPSAAGSVETPFDTDARYSRRHDEPWVGYLVHLTETCGEDEPNVVTHVETAPAPTHDQKATPLVHEALRAKGLLPQTHLADTNYVHPRLLVEARDRYGVDLVGPSRANFGWQARAGTGFDLASFEIDWDRRVAVCPQGNESVTWRQRTRRGQPILGIAFSRSDCGSCPSKDLCVRSGVRGHGRPKRELTVSSKEHHEALKLAREREETPRCAEEYAGRRGIEGTISRAVRTCGLRRARYVGSKRAHLQHVMIATALNFVRVGAWLSGAPRVPARRSPFAALMGSTSSC